SGFEAGEAGTKAEVFAPTERELRVGIAGDVETKGIVEHVFVEVGAGVVEHYAVTFTNGLAPQFDIARCGAAEVVDGRHPPQHLFDRSRDLRGIVREQFPRVRIFDQRQQRAREQRSRGLVGGDRDLYEQARELDLVV